MADKEDVTAQNGVRRIRLEGHGQGNLLSGEHVDAFYQDLSALERDADVGVIVVSGGERDFSAGWSPDFLQSLRPGRRRIALQELQRELIPRVWHSEKLVVVELQGRAFGWACELALLADITIASEDAELGHPEFRSGFVTSSAWAWLAGAKSAKYYLTTGRTLSGEKLAGSGLVNRVVAAEQLPNTVWDLVHDIAKMPSGTATANKRRIGWAWRDVSRSLYDDLFYDVDEEWLIQSRDFDYAFYRKVKDRGFRAAVEDRDRGFSA